MCQNRWVGSAIGYIFRQSDANGNEAVILKTFFLIFESDFIIKENGFAVFNDDFRK